jgi:hypothetical protein
LRRVFRAALRFLTVGESGILTPWRPQGARPAHSTTEAHVGAFFKGLFQTLAFMVVVVAVLFGIFTLVSYLAGPVGG